MTSTINDVFNTGMSTIDIKSQLFEAVKDRDAGDPRKYNQYDSSVWDWYNSQNVTHDAILSGLTAQSDANYPTRTSTDVVGTSYDVPSYVQGQLVPGNYAPDTAQTDTQTAQTGGTGEEVINPQQPNIQASVQPPTVNLQPGATGQEVQQLQNWLVSQGYMTQEQVATGPGIYGPQTTAALAKWQADHNVDNSTGVGYYGPRTMAAIKSVTSSNVTPALSGINAQIQDVQSKLNVISQAEQAGLTVTPQTSYQQAQEFLASPVGSYLSNMGIQANENWTTALQTQPTASVQSLYEQIYENSGLSELKGQINAYNNQIQAYDDELFDKVQEVNDNPWLTEGIRVAQIQKLEDKYENKKANYVAALNRAQSLYDSGREDARWAITQTLAQYNADRNFQQGQLEFAIQRAENARETAANAQQQEFENSLDLAKLSEEMSQFNRSLALEASKTSGDSDELNELLSVDEATKLGVPYGTTKGEAAGLQSQKGSSADNFTRLLGEYSTFLGQYSAVRVASDPTLKATKNSYISQLTAEYKQMKQLGTLDAGVQKLIDGLLGQGGLASFSNTAQKTVVDSLIKSFDTTSTSTSLINTYLNSLGY